MNLHFTIPLGLLGLPLVALGSSQLAMSQREAHELETFSHTLCWADVDGDGLEDVLATHLTAAPSLLRNRGDGSFEDVTRLSGLAQLQGIQEAVFQDLDQDGQPDLVSISASGALRLHRNLGKSSFQDVTQASGLPREAVVQAVRCLDFDVDGRPDLLLELDSGTALLHNHGRGTFEPVRLDLPLPHSPVVVEPPASTVPGSSEVRSPDQSREQAASTGGAAGQSAPSQRTAVLPSKASSTTVSSSTFAGARSAAPAASGICAGSIIDQSGAGGCIAASRIPLEDHLFPLSEDLFVDPGGAVGVGTLSPESDLEIEGSSTSGRLRIGPAGAAAVGTAEVELWGGDGNDHGVSLQYDEGRAAFELWATPIPLFWTIPLLKIDRGTGNVGINVPMTTDPKAQLHIQGHSAEPATILLAAGNLNNGSAEMTLAEDIDVTSGMRMVYDGPANQMKFMGFSDGVEYGPHMVINRSNGHVGIGSDDTYAGFSLSVTGGISTDTLRIRGGSDLVEGFHAPEQGRDPGTVLVIDELVPGHLNLSDHPYDSRVAGVVSGAGDVRPGIVLMQDGVLDGETPVAMTGRVYVKCSAENGAIQPGDLLTTAGLAGHAMRATDRERSFGSVIGKAMGSLDEGTGLVLVLVNLQ